jgi:hypothetical protein
VSRTMIIESRVAYNFTPISYHCDLNQIARRAKQMILC